MFKTFLEPLILKKKNCKRYAGLESNIKTYFLPLKQYFCIFKTFAGIFGY